MRKLTVFFTGIMSVTLSIGYSQTTKIDSLLQVLHSQKKDSSRCNAFSTLSREYLYFKPDSSLLLAQQGLALSREIKLPGEEVMCLNMMGNVIGQKGNDLKALELFIEALQIAEKIHDYRRECISLGNIGIVYLTRGDYQKSIYYHQRLMQLASEKKFEDFYIYYFVNVGENYEKMGQLDSARLYTNQAYEIAQKENNIEIMGAVLISIGHIYTKMNQPEIAIANYKLGMSYARLANYDEGVCIASLGIAKLLSVQKQNDSCLYYARLSFNLAKRNDFAQSILSASNFLAAYYNQHHVVDSAYAYLSMAVVAKDSIFGQEKSQRVENLSFNESIRQQELEAARLSSKKERSTNIQYAFMGLGLVAFMTIFLLLSQSIVVNENWIRFLGVLGLLLLFEFFNLVLHPYIGTLTHHSPLLIWFIMVAVAALLIPLHHRIEHWIVHRMVEKNKRLRLAAAKKTVAELEGTGGE